MNADIWKIERLSHTPRGHRSKPDFSGRRRVDSRKIRVIFSLHIQYAQISHWRHE
jgi:plasmid stabilization system protein ParE